MAKTIVSRFYSQAMSGFAHYLHQELQINPGLDYRLIQASNEPRLLVVQIQINPRHLRKLTSNQMLEELAMATGLAADQRLRIARGPGGSICLEIPKPGTLCFDLRVDQLPRRHGLRAVIGLDTARRPAEVNFAAPLTPHGLISGVTGSGKTNTQQLLAWSLAIHTAPDEARMVIIDVEKQRRTWSAFDRLAHLAHPIIIDIDEARRAVAWTVAELDRRQTQHRSNPHLFLFIEELEELVKRDGFTAPLETLARLGRESGIHLWPATQHPTIEALGSSVLRRNLSVRIVNRVDDAHAALAATGQRNSGAELLTGPGDTIMVQPGSQIRRLTVPKLTPHDLTRPPRLDEIKSLPLAEVEDPDRAVDAVKPAPELDEDEILVRGGSRQTEPITIPQLAYALTASRGITHLADYLGVGSTKAKRIKNLADRLRQEMRALGFIIMDTQEPKLPPLGD